MLPPVLASANQATAATEARQRPDQVAVTRPTTLSQSVAPARIDQDSAIAGQLNIMLLSGPERMSQNLATLADVLGSALKLERRIDESLNDYMGRLIEGIAALPVGDRAKLQKLLSQVFAGLQLRTLLEAMANPTGPGRATLALYLELYRQKDGDGAMRSVISSYRELAGEGRSNPLNPVRAVAANDSLRPAAQPSPAATRTVSQSPLAPSALPLSNPKPGESGPKSPTSIHEQRPASAPLRQAQAAAPLGPSTKGNEHPRDTAAIKPSPVSGAARSTAETASPLPSGRVLSTAGSPSVERMAQLQMSGPTALSGNRPAEPEGEQSRDATGPSGRVSQVAPVFPATALTGAKPALPTGGGWLAELLETDFVSALLQLKSLSPDQSRAAPEGAASNRTTPAELKPPAAASPQGPTEETELASGMPEGGQSSDIADTEAALPIPLAEQAGIRPILAREGVPLPFVSYMIEDDVEWEEEVQEEDDREAEDDGHPQDEERPEFEEASDEADATTLAEADDQPADNVATPALPQGGATRNLALPAPSDTVVQLPPEPAHELYLRMAGLN
ncbi:MAG: hypothetical protein ACK4UW_04590 [Rhizobium rhizophilum]|uniref:hypothetical protein n=1 Tax=Rhizobium rhizophilum TaxID=1850373 RepID=UPI00391AA35D